MERSEEHHGASKEERARATSAGGAPRAYRHREGYQSKGEREQGLARMKQENLGASRQRGWPGFHYCYPDGSRRQGRPNGDWVTVTSSPGSPPDMHHPERSEGHHGAKSAGGAPRTWREALKQRMEPWLQRMEQEQALARMRTASNQLTTEHTKSSAAEQRLHPLEERPGCFAGRPVMRHSLDAISNKKTLKIYVDRGGMSSILAFEVGVRERPADLKMMLVRTFEPSLQFRLVSEHLGPLPDHNTFQECGLADKSMLRLVYTNDSIDISSDEEEEGVAAVQSALRRERSRSPQQRFVVSAAGARGGRAGAREAQANSRRLCDLVPPPPARSKSAEPSGGDGVARREPRATFLVPPPARSKSAEPTLILASSLGISLRMPDTQIRGRNGSTHSAASLGTEN